MSDHLTPPRTGGGITLARRARTALCALAAASLLGGCAALGVGPGGMRAAPSSPAAPSAPADTEGGSTTTPGVVEDAPAREPSHDGDGTDGTGTPSLGAGSLGEEGEADGTPAPQPPTKPLEDAPSYMHPAVGGPLPTTAKPAEVFAEGNSGRYALIVSPSGNIVCQIASREDASCVMKTMNKEFPRDESGAPMNEIAAGGPQVPEQRAPLGELLWQHEGVEAQTIPYGEQVHFDGVVCASERNGMTCWDVTTGHGAFLNKQRIEGF